MTERIVVSPAAGVFDAGRATRAEGTRSQAGDRCSARVGEHEVRSPFGGSCMRACSRVDGERVTVQPADRLAADGMSTPCRPRDACAAACITGWGTALPDKVVTNADLEATLDTSDEWIVERTGIRERRVGGTDRRPRRSRRAGPRIETAGHRPDATSTS